MDDKDRIKELEAEVAKLRTELNDIKEKQAGYKKAYYEKNKEEHIKRVKAYKEQTGYTWKASTEQRRASNRKYYLKKKEREAEAKKKATENVGTIEE
jgi:hypothetical protein